MFNILIEPAQIRTSGKTRSTGPVANEHRITSFHLQKDLSRTSNKLRTKTLTSSTHFFTIFEFITILAEIYNSYVRIRSKHPAKNRHLASGKL